MNIQTYRLGTLTFLANTTAGLRLTDDDLNAFSTDLQAKIAQSVPATYILPAATAASRGGVRPDGTTITINGDVLSVIGSAPTPLAGITIDGSTIPASASTPYQMATADRVVDVNKTTAAPTKILLPVNPTLWVEYTIIDGKRDAATNNITITAASGTMINGGALVVLASNAVSLSLRAVNATTWRIT